MFTLGYFFGVVITLKVFGQNDKIERIQPIESADYSGRDKAVTSQEIFTQLTKINHPNGKDGRSTATLLDKELISALKPESGQKQAYASS